MAPEVRQLWDNLIHRLRDAGEEGMVRSEEMRARN